MNFILALECGSYGARSVGQTKLSGEAAFNNTEDFQFCGNDASSVIAASFEVTSKQPRDFSTSLK